MVGKFFLVFKGSQNILLTCIVFFRLADFHKTNEFLLKELQFPMFLGSSVVNKRKIMGQFIKLLSLSLNFHFCLYKYLSFNILR